MSAPDEARETKLCSDAWLYGSGFARLALPDAGLLMADGDRVTLITKKGTIFDADKSEMQAKWVRIRMGFDFTVGGKLHKMTFGRPKGAEVFNDSRRKSLLEAAIGLSDWTELASDIWAFRQLRQGRAAGQAWRAYFGAEISDPDEDEPNTSGRPSTDPQ